MLDDDKPVSASWSPGTVVITDGGDARVSLPVLATLWTRADVDRLIAELESARDNAWPS